MLVGLRPAGYDGLGQAGGTVSLPEESGEKETMGSNDASSTSKSSGETLTSHGAISLYNASAHAIYSSRLHVALIFLSSEAGTHLRSPVLSSQHSRYDRSLGLSLAFPCLLCSNAAGGNGSPHHLEQEEQHPRSIVDAPQLAIDPLTDEDSAASELL